TNFFAFRSWWVLRVSNPRPSPCKGDALRLSSAPGSGKPASEGGPLAYSVLQRLASLERRILRGLDLDGLAGLRVATGAGSALAHLEGAEADQGDGVALLQRLGDRVDHRVDRARGLGLGDFGFAGDG